MPSLNGIGFVTGPFLNPDNIARDLGGAPSTRDKGGADSEGAAGGELPPISRITLEAHPS